VLPETVNLDVKMGVVEDFLDVQDEWASLLVGSRQPIQSFAQPVSPVAHFGIVKFLSE
jgi:hypothetical protein